jgi:hypothetical protein
MTKLASGQGYSPDCTDEQIIAHFTRKYGYAPCEPGLWTRTPTTIIVPLKEEEDEVQ